MTCIANVMIMARHVVHKAGKLSKGLTSQSQENDGPIFLLGRCSEVEAMDEA